MSTSVGYVKASVSMVSKVYGSNASFQGSELITEMESFKIYLVITVVSCKSLNWI